MELFYLAFLTLFQEQSVDSCSVCRNTGGTRSHAADTFNSGLTKPPGAVLGNVKQGQFQNLFPTAPFESRMSLNIVSHVRLELLPACSQRDKRRLWWALSIKQPRHDATQLPVSRSKLEARVGQAQQCARRCIWGDGGGGGRRMQKLTPDQEHGPALGLGLHCCSSYVSSSWMR